LFALGLGSIKIMLKNSKSRIHVCLVLAWFDKTGVKILRDFAIFSLLYLLLLFAQPRKVKIICKTAMLGKKLKNACGVNDNVNVNDTACTMMQGN
jgi:hypothetical protein